MEKINMKMLSNKKIHFILLWSALFLPSSVFASTVYIDSGHSDFFVGDTVLFHVRVDSENKNINAVEGSVIIDHPAESLSLININTSGSKFSLWPLRPLPSEINTSVSFAGGSPGGLNSSDAIIFNIVLKLQKEGSLTLIPSNLSVYLHDGKGTNDEVHVKDLTIKVLPKKPDSSSVNDMSGIVSNDTTPPEPFEILLGQDKSVFEGKKFLSFYAIDNGSGIDYYEVQEGNLLPVRSNGIYVLKNQKNNDQVIVTAFDAAHNSRRLVYNPSSSEVGSKVGIAYFIVIGLLTLVLIVIFLKRKNVSLSK